MESEKTAVAEENRQQQNVVERVAGIPLVNSAVSMVSGVYSSTKESHPYIRSVCDVAEKGAKTLTDVAVTGSKPLLNRLEPQIATANELACKGLDKLESTLPILQQPTEKVVCDAKLLVTGARDAIIGAVTSTVTGARDTVTSAVSGTMGAATGAIQGSIGATRSVVSTVMESQMGQMVTSSLDVVLDKSEKWVDHYLPMTDEELSQLASTVEGFDVTPLQQQREQQSYYVRLGSLSSRLRHHAYQHSLGKVKNAQSSTAEVLAQLHKIFDLLEGLKQSVQGGQEKLNKLWQEWNLRETEAGSSASENGNENKLMDSRVLGMTQAITQKLQAICITLVAGVQGLPTNIQERMQQLCENAQELHSSFSSACSLGDISATILAQSRERTTKVNEYVNELFNYVLANIPLTWVVGPFAPQLVEHPEEQPEESH